MYLVNNSRGSNGGWHSSTKHKGCDSHWIHSDVQQTAATQRMLVERRCGVFFVISSVDSKIAVQSLDISNVPFVDQSSNVFIQWEEPSPHAFMQKQIPAKIGSASCRERVCQYV